MPSFQRQSYHRIKTLALASYLPVDIGVNVVVIVVVVVVVVVIVVVEVGHDVDDGGGEHEVESQEGTDREALVGAELASLETEVFAVDIIRDGD